VNIFWRLTLIIFKIAQQFYICSRMRDIILIVNLKKYHMKRLFFAMFLIMIAVVFSPSVSYAAVSLPIEQSVEQPVSKKEKLKATKKQLKELRKSYRIETKGMSRAEKKTFIENKLNQSNVNIPNLRLLIIGLVFLLVGVVFYILPLLSWIGYLLQSIGGIIIIVWLILWLLQYA